MPERSSAHAIDTVAIRAAMSQRCCHPLGDRAIGRLTGPIHESGDAAHDNSLPQDKMGSAGRRSGGAAAKSLLFQLNDREYRGEAKSRKGSSKSETADG
jgi:hypothetical protein